MEAVPGSKHASKVRRPAGADRDNSGGLHALTLINSFAWLFASLY